MTAFTTHFTFEFKTGLRNATLLMMNYLFPLGFYAIIGLVMTRINPAFKETLIPAMVVFVAMASMLLGCRARWSSSEKRASSAPTRSTACRPCRF